MEAPISNEKFNVLGKQVKLTSKGKERQEALRAMERVKEEAQSLRITSPGMRYEDIAVLVSLKLADQLIKIEQEYRANLDFFEKSMKDMALSLDEISTSHIS